jgi:hypothetical protein
MRRSARNGEMNETSVISPASVISGDFADAADVLDAVGIGEAEVLGSARGGRCRRRADEGVSARAISFFSTILAMVDLPEPDRPVNQSTTGFWP